MVILSMRMIKMKKILNRILPFVFLFFLFGCNLNNTPTSKVEEKLSNYQMLDKSINNDIESGISILSENMTLTNIQMERFRKIVKKQFRNLVYEVKEEMVDGDTATITVSIEVLNYKSVIDNQVENTDVENLLKQLESVKEKIEYTAYFIVIKDDDGNWNLDSFGEEEISKILGIY